MDSMKVYRGMDIGTAKPPAEEREGWRCVDIVEPWEEFDSRRWVAAAEAGLAEARRDGVPVLVPGGTSLYLKALTEGLFEGPRADLELRARHQRFAEEEGNEALHGRLAAVDSVSAARLHPNDLRRVIRALEVFEKCGQPISELQTQFGSSRPRRIFFVSRERKVMDQRINERVDRMLETGWLEECRRLAGCGQVLARGASQAIGYRELIAWSGEQPFEEVIETIKRQTRRFARRQLTWAKHFADAELVVPGKSWPDPDLVATIGAALLEATGT